MSMKWDLRFLELAKHIAQWSLDPSTKVGSIIVDTNHRIVSTGYNGLPQRVIDRPERYSDRAVKYRCILHSEVNSVLFAKCDLTNHTIFTWPFQPCSVCGGLIIQAGITRVVAPPTPPELAERWKDDIALAQEMFAEAGVILNFLPLSPMIPDKDQSDSLGHE